DVIAEIETDKATMEVEALDDGTIGKILIAAGTEGVKVNSLIAVLLEEGESADAVATAAPAAAPVAEVAAPAATPSAPAVAAVVETVAAEPVISGDAVELTVREALR
ncbi:MAG: biotin/lipoyl-containing protein, partial [Alphaproteobacteria bacterium]